MQSLFASYGIGISFGIPAGCADGQQRVPRQQHIGAAKGKSASLRRGHSRAGTPRTDADSEPHRKVVEHQQAGVPDQGKRPGCRWS